jgi:hypothetical protein
MKKGCQPRACSGVIKREGNKTNKRKRDESRISFVGSLSHYHKKWLVLVLPQALWFFRPVLSLD